jgi:transposase
MRRLTDEIWSKVLEILRFQKVRVGDEARCRLFLEGVFWILRTGAQWRELPVEYGLWNSVYKRFTRWSEMGVWQTLMEAVADDPDKEWASMDATIVRAHPCAAGAPGEKGGSRIRL